MNDRIKELIEQAEEVVFDSPTTGHKTTQFNKEKFAELIIRECAKVALDEAHDPYECILAHFGVE